MLGGSGNDLIQAGSGRSIQIGGSGVDRLLGGNNDDLLIDGTTDYDENAAGLDWFFAKLSNPHKDALTDRGNGETAS